MSDQSQGPGWWQASDLKWYPPETHPDHQASIPAPPLLNPPPLTYPPPVLPNDGRPVSRALAGWVQALLWTVGAFSLISAAIWLAALGSHQEWVDAPNLQRLSDWSDAEDAALGVDAFASLCWIAAIVLFMIWSFRAHKATNRLRPAAERERKWSTGWTIGAWFIPVANVFILAGVIGEIGRIAEAPREEGRVGPDWKQRPMATITRAFFVLLGVSFVLQIVAQVQSGPEALDAGAVDSYYTFSAIAGVAQAAAVVAGVFMVRRIQKALTRT